MEERFNWIFIVNIIWSEIQQFKLISSISNKFYQYFRDNIQLFPSNEVNIKSCQSEGGCFTKQLLEGWQLLCSPHLKAITVLLYRNYS
jgi:hypothetical protein